MADPPSTVMLYARPVSRAAKVVKPAYWVTLASGVLPLLTGVSIFCVWVITRWAWLMTAGIFTIYAGVGMVLVGGVALGGYVHLARKFAPPGHNVLRRAFACAILLFSNVPVAAVIIVAASILMTRYTVVVENATSQALTDVCIFGGGCSENLGSIAPRSSQRCSFNIQHDDELKFQCVWGGATLSKTIDGYVTGGLGGDTAVTVNQDGTIALQAKH